MKRSFGSAAMGLLAALAEGLALPPEVSTGAYRQVHKVGKSKNAKAKKKMTKASKRRNRK